MIFYSILSQETILKIIGLELKFIILGTFSINGNTGLFIFYEVS